MIKVLMQNRIDAFECVGGDTIAMINLRNHLVNLGMSVDVCLDLEPNLKKYDIVNLFNIVRVNESYIHFKNARKQKKPVVVMPIYWDFSELDEKGTNFLVRMTKHIVGLNGFEYAKDLYKVVRDRRQYAIFKKQLFQNYSAKQKELIAGADCVTPNSVMEAEIIEKNIGGFKRSIVYNGVDPKIFLNGAADKFRRKYNISYKKFGLCVGRFDRRKNQINLIRALDKEGIPVIFIGSPGPNYKGYFGKCREKSKNFPTLFIPHMDHDDLAGAYSAAHLHIQPSWLETPGLVSLEAGLSNCNIVLSDRGSVREYFGASAWYCQPDDLTSIRNSVRAAFDAPRGFYDQLKPRIMEKFTWEESARRLRSVYENILRGQI
jgi:glycosyltransferase involved in cell wall biosynthesis